MQIVGESSADGFVAVLFVGFVFLRFTHILGILVVPGTHEPVAFDHVFGRAVQVGFRHEIVEVTGMEEIHPPLTGDLYGLVQIVFAGVHPLTALRREQNLALVVAFIGPSDVRIGEMHNIERFLKAYFDRYLLDVQRGKSVHIPSDPVLVLRPFLHERSVVALLRNLRCAAAERHAGRNSPRYLDEISSIHDSVCYLFQIKR